MRNASVTWLGALVGLGLGAATGQPAMGAMAISARQSLISRVLWRGGSMAVACWTT